MVKPQNYEIPEDAKKVNRQVGYGPNNPEPPQFRQDTPLKNDALHSAVEYIEGQQ